MSYVSKRFILDKLIFCVSNMYFNNVEELYSMIVSGNNVSKSKIDGLWQENAMENMLHEIELIQKGKI